MKLKALGLLRRAGLLVLVVWTVVSLVTLLIELVPGDPAVAVLGDQATPEQLAQFRAKHGLDRPPFFFGLPQDSDGRRHLRWSAVRSSARTARHGSHATAPSRRARRRSGKPHSPAAASGGPAFPERSSCAGADRGRSAGRNRGSLTDNALSVVALIGISLPGFVIGPMLVYVFAVKLGWLAPSGRFDWSDIILPAFTLGAALSAILTRMVRSSVIEELSEGYVRTARAKGLSERTVVYKHVLKNGLIPVVTVLGLQLGILLAGAIITEKIFGWPGLGLLLVEDGIAKRDYRVVQGCVLAISTTYILANLLTDMIYSWLDPRIRVS